MKARIIRVFIQGQKMNIFYKLFWICWNIKLYWLYMYIMHKKHDEKVTYDWFNRDLNRSCLVYMFSLRFSGRKFLINLRRQLRVRKIFSCAQNFSYVSFCGICNLFILCLKLLFWKCVTYVLGCSLLKNRSLTGC